MAVELTLAIGRAAGPERSGGEGVSGGALSLAPPPIDLPLTEVIVKPDRHVEQVEALPAAGLFHIRWECEAIR